MAKHYLVLKMIRNDLQENWVTQLLQITPDVAINFLKAKAIYFSVTDI